MKGKNEIEKLGKIAEGQQEPKRYKLKKTCDSLQWLSISHFSSDLKERRILRQAFPLRGELKVRMQPEEKN